MASTSKGSYLRVAPPIYTELRQHSEISTLTITRVGEIVLALGLRALHGEHDGNILKALDAATQTPQKQEE